MGPAYRLPISVSSVPPGLLDRKSNHLHRVHLSRNIRGKLVSVKGSRLSGWWRSRTCLWFPDRVRSGAVYKGIVRPAKNKKEFNKAL